MELLVFFTSILLRATIYEIIVKTLMTYLRNLRRYFSYKGKYDYNI